MGDLDRLSYGARGLLLSELVHLDPERDSINPEIFVTPKNRITSVRNLLDELEAEGFLRRWREGRGRGPRGQLAGGTRVAWRLHPRGDAPPAT